MQALGKSHGFAKLIGLDMGGTSTDVCRVDGELDLEFETIKAGVRMLTPTLRIHTVAAGGGSICWFDGVQLRVGPQSAGSQPGPACYGRGGPLTVTDLNLLAGRIHKEAFPFPLDETAALEALRRVLMALNTTRPQSPLSETELVEGFRRIANEHMASAVRSISISQGADPREHTLVCFGGAAGQHICQIAEQLGMTTILDPPQAGLLSAAGMGLASKQRTDSTPVYRLVQDLEPIGFGICTSDGNPKWPRYRGMESSSSDRGEICRDRRYDRLDLAFGQVVYRSVRAAVSNRAPKAIWL